MANAQKTRHVAGYFVRSHLALAAKRKGGAERRSGGSNRSAISPVQPATEPGQLPCHIQILPFPCFALSAVALLLVNVSRIRRMGCVICVGTLKSHSPTAPSYVTICCALFLNALCTHSYERLITQQAQGI